MKSLYEKLNINKDVKIRKTVSYTFYENDSDVREGDKVLYSCRCGDGSSIFVKCIIDKIFYSKFNGKQTDAIYNINLKLDDDNISWIKDDSTVKSSVENGVYGHKFKSQLLKLEN